MKTIKSITIEELFGSYNHHIEFKQQEDITILLGQNGIGKTSILKILDMLFNHQLSLLTQILFKKTTIVFDNDLELIIKLVNGTSEQAFDYEFSQQVIGFLEKTLAIYQNCYALHQITVCCHDNKNQQDLSIIHFP